jgi:hypothetical protein
MAMASYWCISWRQVDRAVWSKARGSVSYEKRCRPGSEQAKASTKDSSIKDHSTKDPRNVEYRQEMGWTRSNGGGSRDGGFLCFGPDGV